MSLIRKNTISQKNNNIFSFEDIKSILNNMCYIKEKNIINLDYKFFKNIACDKSYHFIIKKITEIFNKVLETNDLLVVHINMNCLTLIELDKHYKFTNEVIELLKTTYPNKLDKCYIYNTPFIFSQLYNLVSILLDKKTLNKIKILDKLVE
jgi:hypothetical protein